MRRAREGGRCWEGIAKGCVGHCWHRVGVWIMRCLSVGDIEGAMFMDTEYRDDYVR